MIQFLALAWTALLVAFLLAGVWLAWCSWRRGDDA
jgi:hypothetical protein